MEICWSYGFRFRLRSSSFLWKFGQASDPIDVRGPLLAAVLRDMSGGWAAAAQLVDTGAPLAYAATRALEAANVQHWTWLEHFRFEDRQVPSYEDLEVRPIDWLVGIAGLTGRDGELRVALELADPGANWGPSERAWLGLRRGRHGCGEGPQFGPGSDLSRQWPGDDR